ncbi:neuronal PAS domain-containing protein 4 [Alca torda]
MLSLSLPGHILPDGWLCRSTKSASKARRDQINVELQALRSLLPISAREKERLSYLHTMALVCLRMRGAQLFPPGTHGTAVPHDGLALPGALLLPHRDSASPCAPPADSAPPVGPALGTELLSLLPGFLLVLSANGKLVYISENVDQVLGLSMVRPVHQAFAVAAPVLVPLLRAWHVALADAGLWLQQAARSGCQPTGHQGRDSVQWQPPLYQVELLAQGDTVFDILAGRTHEDVRKKLLLAQEQPGKGKGGLSWRLTDAAALPWPFVAAVREPGPAEQGNPAKHSVPTPLVFPSVTYHLGYRREELIGQSWYSLLHPEDADLAAAQHRAVGECQAWEHAWLCQAKPETWLYRTTEKK